MKLKVMVTGRNKRIASDISNHLIVDRGYEIIKCPPTQDKLLGVVLSELPRIIIVCLGDETSETARVFDILGEATKFGGVTVVVIANSEDRRLFMKYTRLERMLFIARPVSLYTLYEKFLELENKLESEDEDNPYAMQLYVNDTYTFDEDRKKHILVVDDDPMQLIQIKGLLKEFYEVTLVNSGDNAIRFLNKHSVDLILLDYIMPDKNGPDVLSEIRTYSEFRKIPVIFLTGVTEKDVVIKTIVELKPDGYVVKPSKKSELVAKIIDVLG